MEAQQTVSTFRVSLGKLPRLSILLFPPLKWVNNSAFLIKLLWWEIATKRPYQTVWHGRCWLRATIIDNVRHCRVWGEDGCVAVAWMVLLQLR